MNHNYLLRKQHTRKVGRHNVLVNARDALEKNSANFIPWRVTFEWMKTAHSPCIKAVFYVRSPNPGMAGSWASKLWHHWTRGMLTPFDKFPKMESQAQVERITDPEFMQELASATLSDFKYPEKDERRTLFAGEIVNPRAFWPRGLCLGSFQI